MFRKVFTVSLILLFPVLCSAQGIWEKSAQKHLSKHRYKKAYSALRKSLRKNPADLPSRYLFTRYYFAPANPEFNLDSAYRYAKESFRLWSAADARDRHRWSRFPVDSMRIASLWVEIDSAWFVEARRKDTEAAYTTFLESFPSSPNQQTAMALRSDAAYRQALEQNTFTAFSAFMEKYPGARQVPEARKRYDELLFQHSTRDQSLQSYEEYLKANPQTPYRAVVEKNIFELLTVPGTPEAFQDFLIRYPGSSFRKKAADILYHLLAEENQEALFPAPLMTDSISRISNASRDYLVPFLTRGKFGFMSSSGKEVIAAQAEEVSEDYLCGGITEDVLVLPGRMVTRNGATIWKGNISALSDLGYGFLFIEQPDQNRLIHKSGFAIAAESVQKARVLNGRVLAVQSNDKWGIYSLSGRRLVSLEYDDIYSIGEAVVMQRGDQYSLSSVSSIASVAPKTDQQVETFDEVRKLNDKVWVRRGELQALYNDTLRLLVKPDTQQITPAFFGAFAFSSGGYVTYNNYGEESERFEKLEVKEPWVAARAKGGWVIYDPAQRMYKSVPYDSLAVFGPFAVGLKNGTMEVNFYRKPNFTLSLTHPGKVEFVPGDDSVSYLMIEQDRKMAIYNPQGEKILTVNHDRISFGGEGYFITHKAEKKGLITASGRQILPIEYDAIGTLKDGHISLLKSMKFGMYDVRTKKLIKPSYDKNITPYNSTTLVAFKDGHYGFITLENERLGDFTFSEVQPWTDSVALVKEDDIWSLYHIRNQKRLETDIVGYRVIRDNPDDRLYIFSKKGQSGVIGSRKGTVIPIRFTDIVNVGTAEKPLYFTEKHVEEASLFVVIYYNSEGKRIRRDIFEQDDYERIYCDGK